MKKIVFGITITTVFLLAGFFGFGRASSNVSGEAFLRTKGGSVITCAGSPVYIEKSNPKGYIFLTTTIKNKKAYANVLSKTNIIEHDNGAQRLWNLEHKLENSLLYIPRLENKLENSSLELRKLQNGLKPDSPDAATDYIKKQYEMAKSSRDLKSKAYWKERLKKRSPNFVKKETEQKIEKIRKEIAQEKVNSKKYLEEIKKVKKENEEEEKINSKKLHNTLKEISKLEEQLRKVTKENTKKSTCNSQGHFAFTGLSPDSYYISTTVEWFVGDEKQGGILTKTVILNEGENKIFINR